MRRSLNRLAVAQRRSRHAIGLRREDKNCWERRAPFSPQVVKQLIKEHDVEVVVQPSGIRCFSDEEYKEAGASIQEDLSNVNSIFAVKEVPVTKLLPNMTYSFFSHVIKGQAYNMPMLDNILSKNIRLIDYERIVNANNERLVKFGSFAGLSAAIDTLHVVGERLLTHYGFTTPFVNVGWARNFIGFESARKVVKNVGDVISKYGLPTELYPFVITITGNGAVSNGAKSIIDLLPVKYVKSSELPALFAKPAPATKEQHNQIYVCIATAEDMVQHKEKKPFEKRHYYANPQEYEPVFHEKVMPYTKVLFNGIYWEQKFPRLLTIAQAQQLVAEKRLPLVAHADISCDINGSFEFLTHSTTINDPVYGFDLVANKDCDVRDLDYGKIAVMGVDNWPASFSRSATEYFGGLLLPFIPSIARSDMNKPLDQQNLVPEVKTAVITSHGSLTPNYTYIAEIRRKREEKNLMLDKQRKKILLLGSGYVVEPIVEYLVRYDMIKHVTLAGLDVHRSEDMAKKYGKAKISSVYLDVTSEQHQKALDTMVEEHDMVLSLVPAPLHPIVARKCIAHKKNMITASYVSPDMKSLHEEAKAAGVMLLNEIGLDPGIDHMCVMKTIEEIKAKGGKVTSFQSYCGALPAPECTNNPLGYKFSWSPRGVLTAAQNAALYKMNNETVNVPGELLMFNARAPPSRLAYPAFAFEMIPNRDSLKYINYYGLNETDLKTMIRGTLRFPGFCNTFRAFKHLGFLSDEKVTVTNWFDLVNKYILPAPVQTEKEMEQVVSNKLLVALRKIYTNSNAIIVTPKDAIQIQADVQNALVGMKQLRLFSKDSLPCTGSVTDILCKHLESKLAYLPHERDLIYMHHEFEATYATHSELVTATLCAYGDPKGFSATAATVGKPVAIAAVLYLQGKLPSLQGAGVCGPTEKALYTQCLEELDKEGIQIVEETLRI